ncbi:RlpA-like double-psi beta-barrel-protein domain-containing protein-containing protein, partial [Podospora australis]
KATFTYYGSGDYGGSPNCNTSRNACARPPDGRYTAAVSEALFGAAPGEGAGMACGTCWRLDTADCSGLGLKSITVVVNNLCPAAGNPLCGQRDLKHTNQYGAEVNFNLCIDSGAASALFAKSGLGLTTGTATSVDCDSDAAYPECPSLPSH